MKKINVELCIDHFDRVRRDDVCSTCPSSVLNEKRVLALSKILEEDTSNRVISSEIISIRRHQQEYSKKIDLMDEAIRGNGKPGIISRLVVIETTMNVLKWSIGILLTLFAIFVTIYLSK